MEGVTNLDETHLSEICAAFVPNHVGLESQPAMIPSFPVQSTLLLSICPFGKVHLGVLFSPKITQMRSRSRSKGYHERTRHPTRTLLHLPDMANYSYQAVSRPSPPRDSWPSSTFGPVHEKFQIDWLQFEIACAFSDDADHPFETTPLREVLGACPLLTKKQRYCSSKLKNECVV